MALKKSHLYRSLWSSCDELRGGMDASQYKDYVLTLLFVKYVSDKYAGKPGALIDVPGGGSFADMVAARGDPNIGELLDKIIARLAEANGLKNVIDIAEFNNEDKLGRGKEMQDRLSKLVGIFSGLDLRANRPEGDDLLGDAYEYLMRHFATESGKSKGQFYTPAEVSRVMAKVVGIGPQTRPDDTIYDPTCGSGSLLLKAATEAPRGISIYGQEMDNATWALARMNMILHEQPTADLGPSNGNTLAAPHFKNVDGSLKTFDFAVANPPFSAKAWRTGFKPEDDDFERFKGFGVPPPRKGDYAFLLHAVKSLKSTGKAAVILPHGVLFRGKKEADIRRNLVKRGLIKGVIGLPPNLFYGTGIPACILVIDKENAQARTGIFMIDASRGFAKDGNKNRLREQDIRKIVDVFNGRIPLPRYSRVVPVVDIEANDYNLNIPRYIDASEPEDVHDLDGHLRGGIPASDVDDLSRYWTVFPSLRAQLFEPGDRPGYFRARVAVDQVKSTTLANSEYRAYASRVHALYEAWRAAHEPDLFSINASSTSKELVRQLSEDLLVRFAETPLLDRYDVYQSLMGYWDATMQDDVFLVIAGGWVSAAKPRVIVEDKEKKLKEVPDLIVGHTRYKMDLLPPSLLIARFFAGPVDSYAALESRRIDADSALEEFTQEHSGEDGLLEDVINDKGNVTKTAVQARLKEVAEDPDSGEERMVLGRCLELINAQARAEQALKAAHTKILARYATLSEDEIRTIAVTDKWLAAIEAGITGELERLIQNLVDRVTELERRYARTLPDLERDAQDRAVRVRDQLIQMGFVSA